MSEDATGKTVRLRRGDAARLTLEVDALAVRVEAGPDAGQKAAFTLPCIRVGTAPENDLVLTDPAVSRHHAEFLVAEEGVTLRDLGSTNGSRIEGVEVSEGRVPEGGRCRLGDTELVLSRRTRKRHARVLEEDAFEGLVGKSPPMRELYGLLRAVGPTDVSVLLTGESGTGKEVVARAIHSLSGRKGRLAVFDAAATDPEMIRSELFGHEKGAFTGAAGARTGAFREADGGTLFIDELGELPLDLQPRLLRALERREVTPVGSDRAVPVDVRVVAATHRDLAAMVQEGSFRADLYHRLAVFPVELPALRDRREDVPLLARHLAGEGSGDLVFSEEALEALAGYPWPGNVRELRNVLARVGVLCRDRPVEVRDLRLPGAAGAGPAASGPGEPETLEAAERRMIQDALARHGGDREAAAVELGISARTLRRRLAAWGEE